MSTIKYYLDRPNAENLHPIFLVYQSKGKKFKHYTGEKIKKKDWNPKKGSVRVSVDDASEINSYLDNLRKKLKKIERDALTSGEILTIPALKYRFLNYDESGQKNRAVYDFMEVLDQYIENASHTRRHASIQIYKTMKTNLLDFKKRYKVQLTFESFDLHFFERYVKYLISAHGNTNNTIQKKISRIKAFLNYASKIDANQNFAYKEFKVKKVEVQKIYLTQEELGKIYRLDLTQIPRLDKVRDVFCFGAFTGLRYSDVENLKPNDIKTYKGKNGNPDFQGVEIYMVKTKDPIIIPLNRYALEIISKYEGKYEKSLPVISNQKTNGYIKEVTKMAEINGLETVVKFRGAERIEEHAPRYQLIAMHTSRRTFAVLSLENGMRVEVLQKILGHASIRTTMQYVRILESIKNRQMQDTWNNINI